MSMTMMMSTTSVLRPNNMILTFGASGRVYALLSLRALCALIQLLLRGLLLVLLHIHIPFCRARSNTTVSQGRPVLARVPSGRGLLRRRPKVDKEAAARRQMAIRRLSNTDGGHFSLFTTDRGDTIFTRSWTPKQQTKTRGVVVLMHGLNEHSARYHDFANQLNHIGLKVYAMDWIGHGGSDGLHGYVHSLDAAVDDLKSLLAKKVLLADTGLPCFLFGHSTGAAIVLKAALDPMIKARIQGVVLTSPAIHVETSHPIVPIVAPIFSLFVPKLQFGAADKKDGPPVSRDPEAVRAKYSDPLVFTGAIRVRTGYEILRISSHLQRNLHRVDVPFLVMHGTADTVSEPKASQRLYDMAASSDKSIKLYQGFVHDLLFELERDQISQDILHWLSSRIR